MENKKKKCPLHQHKPLENMSRFACNNATSKSIPNQPIVRTIQYDPLYRLVATTVFTQKLIGKHAHSLLENVPSQLPSLSSLKLSKKSLQQVSSNHTFYEYNTSHRFSIPVDLKSSVIVEQKPLKIYDVISNSYQLPLL